MISKDLDYVVTHWRLSSFDLWEEVNDVDHFFTKMVQRKSLIDGAELFTALNVGLRVPAWRYTAEELASSLDKHWNASRGYLTETVNQQSYKGGGLDSSIILGVLYGNTNNPQQAFSVIDERVMSTVYFLRNSFAGLYKLNIAHPALPPLMGRYPNDIYDGDQFLYGNPWPLITNALAQYYYACANILEKEGEIQITPTNILFYQLLQLKLDKHEQIVESKQPEKFHAIIAALRHEGDALLANVKSYASCYDDNTCLHYNEQIDRTSGKQVSARDLTWGYATVLGAMRFR